MTQLAIPLFPLPNVVHFPRTDLRLHIFEPRYRQLIADLERQDEGRRWIGMVLLKPVQQPAAAAPPPIFPAGTAGQLVEVSYLPDGRSNILLRGEFRFDIDRELPSRPYRQAMVRQLLEPSIHEEDAGVSALRRELVELASALAGEMGDGFPLPVPALSRVAEDFEPLVNSLAANLDLPVLRKLALLNDPLPERALNVLSILRGRRKVLDLLRPFRRFAAGAELN